MAANIVPVLARKERIVKAKPDRHTPMRQVAESLDRRLAVAATVELVTESLHRLAELAYQTDRAGWVNADPVTGRLLIPAPMGKAGRSMWGLYPSEGLTLNAILRNRQRRKGHVPWLAYDPSVRAWRVNLAHYPDLSAALDYLKRCRITVEEWRFFAEKTRRPR